MFRVEWCIRQISCPSIILHSATIIAHDQYTDVYPQTYIFIHIQRLKLMDGSPNGKGGGGEGIFLICDIDADEAINTILRLPQPPDLIIVDSIQTMRVASGMFFVFM